MNALVDMVDVVSNSETLVFAGTSVVRRSEENKEYQRYMSPLETTFYKKLLEKTFRWQGLIRIGQMDLEAKFTYILRKDIKDIEWSVLCPDLTVHSADTQLFSVDPEKKDGHPVFIKESDGSLTNLPQFVSKWIVKHRVPFPPRPEKYAPGPCLHCGRARHRRRIGPQNN